MCLRQFFIRESKSISLRDYILNLMGKYSSIFSRMLLNGHITLTLAHYKQKPNCPNIIVIS